MSASRAKSPDKRSTSKSRNSLDEGRKIPTFELQGSVESATAPVDVTPHLLRVVHPRFLYNGPDEPETTSRQVSVEPQTHGSMVSRRSPTPGASVTIGQRTTDRSKVTAPGKEGGPTAPSSTLEIGIRRTLQQYSTNPDIPGIAQLLAATALHEDVFETVLNSKVQTLQLVPVQAHLLTNAVKDMVKVAKDPPFPSASPVFHVPKVPAAPLQRPFQAKDSKGATVWYESQDEKDIERPPAGISDLQPGYLWYHKNTSTNSPSYWMYNAGGDWVKVGYRQPHVTLPNRVLTFWTDGTPNFVTVASANTMEGRKKKGSK